MTKFNDNIKRAANTSVLPLQNSENFLALVESDMPFVLNKKNGESIGHKDFGWINTGYSAHPKVDPDNGDIYNIGTDFDKWTLTLSHCNKEMKLIKKEIMKLRSSQSIHDFCLAGDYIVIFECSMNLSVWNLLFGSSIL